MATESCFYDYQEAILKDGPEADVQWVL